MPSQQQRSEATRSLLLDAFRKSLLEKGLGATTMASVLADTGLSKGALYHHFASKTEIIEALYRVDSHGAIRRASDAVPAGTAPVERLKSACANWLMEMRKPDIGGIVLGVGPRALGLERVIEIESELSLGMFEATLGEAEATGAIDLSDRRLAARLINAMLTELATVGAKRSAEPEALVAPLIDGILGALSGTD